jgi:hypothetical protein
LVLTNGVQYARQLQQGVEFTRMVAIVEFLSLVAGWSTVVEDHSWASVDLVLDCAQVLGCVGG